MFINTRIVANRSLGKFYKNRYALSTLQATVLYGPQRILALSNVKTHLISASYFEIVETSLPRPLL